MPLFADHNQPAFDSTNQDEQQLVLLADRLGIFARKIGD
jgi:hypothetical protein